MSSIIARTGRHHQRYDEDNLRLVSGCIPYRLVEDDGGHYTNLESKIEVLMVSSPNRDDLVFPKGGWEDDETLQEAAQREALEEAGVKGKLGEKLGEWEFRSKSSQEVGSLKSGCRGHMFALEVTEELEVWPEQGNRGRKWLFINEAFKHCRYEWMCRALEKFVKVVLKNWKHEMNKEAKVLHPVPVSYVEGTKKMLTSCHVKPSRAQNHELDPLGCFLDLVPTCTILQKISHVTIDHYPAFHIDQEHIRSTKFISLVLPNLDTFKINTNAGMKGNSGTIGGMCRDCQGRRIRGFYSKTGMCSIAAADIKFFTIESDSEVGTELIMNPSRN